MEDRIMQLNRYLIGWIGYFRLASAKGHCEKFDQWIRRRLRMCLWKQWKRVRTRIRELRALGVPPSSTGVTIPAGGQVAMLATEAGTSGTTNSDWLLIRWYRDSATAPWYSANALIGGGVKHAFAPVGYNHGSTESTIGIYGNW